MTTPASVDASTARDESPASDPVGRRVIEGDLECLCAFEVLQVLQFLGKRGQLSFTGGAGQTARCTITPEGLLAAVCGPLGEREAALAFAWWREGRFRFETAASERRVEAPVDPVAALPVQEVLLEAVRLADEIEARAGFVPDRTEPLQRLHQEPLQSEISGLPAAVEILEALEASSGLSRIDLEAALPYAPVTIGFALARLCEEGYVGGRIEPSPVPSSTDGTDRVLDAGGLIRILIAFDRDSGQGAGRILDSIYESLDAPIGPGALDFTVPSFHRSRLASGRFLSVTVLPVSRRNRFVLESLVAALDLAIIVASRADGGEVLEWLGLSPPSLKLVFAERNDEAIAELRPVLQLLFPRGRH